MLILVCLILIIVTNIWALVIIFRRSILGGVLSLIFGFPILYFLVTGWGKEGEDIRTPFFLTFILAGIALALGLSVSKNVVKELQPELSAPATRPAPSFREAPASESTRVTDTPRTLPADAPQAGMRRPEAVKQAPRRQRPAQSDCVYKPVMTDEDLAKCK